MLTTAEPLRICHIFMEENSMIPHHRMKFITCQSLCLSQLSGQIAPSSEALVPQETPSTLGQGIKTLLTL